MAALHPNLRKKLEKTVVKARDIAEKAAQNALQALAVDIPKPFDHMTEERCELRDRLRAHAHAIGDRYNQKTNKRDLYHLIRETAYEHWHRMLFACFLAENNLLMHPDGVPVKLDECEELAAEEGLDKWELASRYAAKMLPAIFRSDDPTLQLEFAPEDKLELEKLIADLEPDIFTADDSLGWVYQFWQSRKKDEVNRSEKKIGADELPAVTQLFTEDYMVKFLLHNSLGAWWAGKFLAKNPEMATNKDLTEDDLRKALAFEDYHFEFLRFIFNEEKGQWLPAAGCFEGWPKEAKDVTILDPSCGSGHFLVAAFELMVRIRMSEEGLSAKEAIDVILRDNIFGLEIDARCTQIAAFALAFTAWKFPNAEGFRELSQLNIACSGIPVTAKKEDWLKLANGDEKLKNGMDRLWTLFRQAPVLGSLIDPTIGDKHELIEASFDNLQPLLEKALESEKTKTDFDLNETAVAAKGIAQATKVLANKYTLTLTNVPYLSSQKHDLVLHTFCEEYYSLEKLDLATVFVSRCVKFCTESGHIALVTPYAWLFQTAYKKLRKRYLSERSLLLLSHLGPGAFDTISGEVVNVCLFILGKKYKESNKYAGIDVSESRGAIIKTRQLISDKITTFPQEDQLKNPDHRILLQVCVSTNYMSDYALAPQGIKTGDDDRWRRCFWELFRICVGWEYYQSTVNVQLYYGGREHIIDWSKQGKGMPCRRPLNEAVGNLGVAVSQTGNLPTTIYTGQRYDSNVGPIVPKNTNHLLALWAYCSSEEYVAEIRKIDKSLKVTNATLIKVPFELERWQKVAEEKYPNGLPEPYSDDPTQWIFKGAVNDTIEPLQVAISRLLGYRWPEQINKSEIEKLVDEDGIVCIPAVRGEQPAADRLRSILAAAFNSKWSPVKETELLSTADGRRGLEDWLRNKFFIQHCKLFHNRPFIWHLWDGERDGFGVLVNYHKLDKKLLETLTYAYLGDWINKQKSDFEAGIAGADVRMLAAQILQKKLQLILRGEKPYDIFVRWKPIEEQPIGWEPDLNDGVRMNIRPFFEADVLRKKPNIKWKKDRGKEPTRPKEQYPWFWDGSEFVRERVNDVHLSLQEKQEAREKAAKEAVK